MLIRQKISLLLCVCFLLTFPFLANSYEVLINEINDYLAVSIVNDSDIAIEIDLERSLSLSANGGLSFYIMDSSKLYEMKAHIRPSLENEMLIIPPYGVIGRLFPIEYISFLHGADYGVYDVKARICLVPNQDSSCRLSRGIRLKVSEVESSGAK